VLSHLESSDEHLFITGKAGTGKSTLLSIFRSTTKKRVAILAPTGIAALNVKGQTIHSFFGFPPRMIDTNEIVKRKNSRIYCNLDMIIIDEVSMVRADIMDNINFFLQINREVYSPFGGVQMVFFGDMFQLPPVVSTPFERQYFREHFSSQYFFSSKVIENEIDLRMVELNQVYRQDERIFLKLLDNIRLNCVDEDDFELINERFLPLPENKDYFITLSSRNASVDAINNTEIAKIEDAKMIYPATIKGEFNPQLYPTESQLLLKRGAQVMFVKNDPLKQFVNGTIGTITHISNNDIYAKILDEQGNEKELKVEEQEWEIIRYTKDKEHDQKIAIETIGTFRQYPIKLAWAITIHKSQGKTFDKVIIDMAGGAFEFGQTYVALSRCRTLSGVYLKSPLKPRDIMVDVAVCEWYDTMKRR
jgi:ATP-dependent exoDNAse (exonuclease V) alpha subunit